MRFCNRNRLRRGFLCADAFERAGLYHLAAQRVAEFDKIDHVSVFAHHIDHIQRDYRRNAKLKQLRGQIEVAFDVAAVHDVDDRIRPLCHEIVARDDLLQRVRRERVDTGQVLDDRLLIPF